MEKSRQFLAPPSAEAVRLLELPSWAYRLLVILAITALCLARSPEPAAAQTVAEATSVLPEVYYGRPATEEEAASSVLVDGDCSGTILSEYVISTALHCVIDEKNQLIPPSDIGVVLAGGNENQPYYKVKYVQVIGKDIIPYTFDNDKAVLILNRPLIFNEKVHAIPIGYPEMIGSYPLFAVGHGRSELGWIANIVPNTGKQTYQPSETCGPPFGYSITTGHTPNPDPYAEDTEVEIIPVIAKRDSGGRLHAVVPAGDPNYPEGMYIVGITSLICGFIKYYENGYPIPDYYMGFQSVVIDEVKKELEEIIAIAPTLADKLTYLPSISNGNFSTHLPAISVED